MTYFLPLKVHQHRFIVVAIDCVKEVFITFYQRHYQHHTYLSNGITAATTTNATIIANIVVVIIMTTIRVIVVNDVVGPFSSLSNQLNSNQINLYCS